MKNAQSENGFVLMEVIMGIAIAAAMLVSLIDSYYDAVNIIHKASRNQKAVNIAQKHAEEILNMEEGMILGTYSDYESKEGEYRVCIRLSVESETGVLGVRAEKIEKDMLVEICGNEVLIDKVEMPTPKNMQIIISKSGEMLVQPYGMSIAVVEKGRIVILQREEADIESINVKNESEASVHVYSFANPKYDACDVEIEGKNIWVQEEKSCLENGYRLLKANICVYFKDNMEAEIVTYRNVRY